MIRVRTNHVTRDLTITMDGDDAISVRMFLENHLSWDRDPKIDDATAIEDALREIVDT